jgi:hypothetical protein
MIFTDPAGAAVALMVMIALFTVVHYTSPPKAWGDVTQSLIYHQVCPAFLYGLPSPSLSLSPVGSQVPLTS